MGGGRLKVAVRLSKGLGPFQLSLARTLALPHGGTSGVRGGAVIGRGFVVGWVGVVTGPHSLADPRVVPLSLKVVAAVWQVCSGFHLPLSPPPTCKVEAVLWAEVLLGQRIDGVDRRRGL